MMKWARVGALVGVVWFAGLLAVHVAIHGGVAARYGCVIGPEQRAINLPATIVEAIAPNPWVHPQRFGEPTPPGAMGDGYESISDRWSAPAWVATGALAYALVGAFLASVARLIAALRQA
jgi:hypothetical protein